MYTAEGVKRKSLFVYTLFAVIPQETLDTLRAVVISFVPLARRAVRRVYGMVVVCNENLKDQRRVRWGAQMTLS